mmetsp:Transcript_74911/g.193330  ORF Transcript_74911/g.193330 Transcript_74911/m.193330 type:complete len:285 (-) Transcript_74911:2025-2879(-)
MLLQPHGHPLLRLVLRGDPPRLELFVILDPVQAADERQVPEPSIAPELLCDELRQHGIRAMNPATLRGAAGDVHELARLAARHRPPAESREGLALHDLRVHSSHSIDVVGANDREVAHLQGIVLPHRHVADPLTVPPLCLHLLQEHAVHQIHDLHVPGQHMADQASLPLLQRVRHHCLAGVAESRLAQLPRVGRIKALHVYQQAHELRHGEGGVGVIKVDLHLLWEHVPVAAVDFLEAPQDVLDRGTAVEVLLTKAQLLTLIMLIIWVEEAVELQSTRLRPCCV